MSDIEDLFAEPEGFRPPPPENHFADYSRVVDRAPSQIKLRLVGSSPLWGHLLWNAGIFTANYIDEHPELCKNKRVLELGAASGLPGIICGLNGASRVISTDYPDPDLLQNIQYNVDHCDGLPAGSVEVKGFIWGGDKADIYGSDHGDVSEDDKFDLLILSDLVFNHTEHHKLLSDCRRFLKRSGRALVVFSPHRPWLLANDLEFFETATQYQLASEKIDLVSWKPMFEEDEETADVRARVYSYFLVPQW